MAEVEKIILSLIERDIPEGRKALKDGHENLAKVATYCQQKYQESNNRYKGASDKAKVREETREVLNETKQFATQSLASVAYQINTLAVNMLNLFDQQAFQLQTMESQINHISETVNIHKEKVARREIGVLATSKNTTRTHKIIAPAKQEKAERYTRKPVDYSILDNTGHGVKISQSDRRHSTKSSIKKRQPSPTSQSNTLLKKPATRSDIKPPPPPVPPPMPPSLPSGADNYDSVDSVRQTGSPPSPVQSVPVVNPSRVVVQPPAAPIKPPMESGGNSPPPPPPFPTSTNLPPPPGDESDTYEAVDDILSPPPPPPPPDDFDTSTNSFPMPLPPAEDWYDIAPPISTAQMPPPPPPIGEGNVPAEYLEKVMALYDYTAMREDELTFTENMIIYVVKKNDDGWFEGVIAGSGESGLFPGNYVEPALGGD